jgi:steroid 5-alpha reductase family enzyme
MMSKKWSTLAELLGIYLIGFAIGVLVFLNLRVWVMNPIVLAFFADIAMTLFIWLYGLVRKNSSVYDPYWSVVPPVLLIGLAIYLEAVWTLPTILLIAGISFWAIRLTHNWFIGWTDFSEQDWRYTMIKEKHPKIWMLSNLFGIMLMPTVIVFIQLIGASYVISAAASLNLIVVAGFLMIVGATIIQYLSDKQMREFKERNRGSKKCIEEGLWKYSRHPNYFGEVSVWWGVYIIYVGVQGKLDLVILPPILMTALFLFISIPMMEKKILKTRPEYADYQDRVSMIIPFPAKQATQTNDDLVQE